MGLARVGLYWRTLRHLRAEQLLYLIWRRVLRQPRRVSMPRAVSPKLTAAAACLLPLSRPCWLGAHRFRFLNREHDFGERIDWQASSESRLWRYNLHYFDWLRQPDCEPAQALGHMQEWITANPPFVGTGWEPYPSSLRLVNWLAVLAALPAAAVPRRVVDSVALQTSWLLGNIEYQLGANHLFVNLKALLFAAGFLGGEYGRDLARRSGARFERELAEQFLLDGGHYERSPMYHAILTQDLLELTALCERNPSLLPVATVQSLLRTTERALAFASVMQPPDDGIFLFNDAAANIAPSCGELFGFAARAAGMKLPARSNGMCYRACAETGYYVVRRSRDMVVFDCGEVGPGHQAGHAHCDTLSFELYLEGRRILTNIGNHDYVDGSTRRYARSTKAHNTVVVDDAEQSEIWGAFRVGRRAFPLSATLGPCENGVTFRGAHDGYFRLPGAVVHTRTAVIAEDFSIQLRDELTGSGMHKADSWLHLAVGLRLRSAGISFEILNEKGKLLAVVDAISECRVKIIETPRYPEFGVAETGISLCLSISSELPADIACRIVPSRDR